MGKTGMVVRQSFLSLTRVRTGTYWYFLYIALLYGSRLLALLRITVALYWYVGFGSKVGLLLVKQEQ